MGEKAVWYTGVCAGTQGYVLTLPFNTTDIHGKRAYQGQEIISEHPKEPEWVPTHSYLDIFFLSCEVQTTSKKTLFAFKSNVMGIIQILDGLPASRKTSASLEIKP